MKTTPDYDLAPYLATGRQLRSQAFIMAFRMVRDWLKGVIASEPSAAGRVRNA